MIWFAVLLILVVSSIASAGVPPYGPFDFGPWKYAKFRNIRSLNPPRWVYFGPFDSRVVLPDGASPCLEFLGKIGRLMDHMGFEFADCVQTRPDGNIVNINPTDHDFWFAWFSSRTPASENFGKVYMGAGALLSKEECVDFARGFIGGFSSGTPLWSYATCAQYRPSPW